MAIVIQDTWTEPDDEELRTFVAGLDRPVQNLSRAEILELPLKAIDALFCDTSVVQQLLRDRRIQYDVPPTYPPEFTGFYCREIRRVPVRSALDRQGSFFVKPTGQSKDFDGFVVETKYDVEHLLEAVPALDEEVFCCEVVQFVSEFRLFIADLQIAGVVESSDCVIADYKNPLAPSARPPTLFVDRLLGAIPRTRSWAYCVVDVGQLRSGEWAVVEANPPFALSSYDWPVAEYYAYCRDAWHHITAAAQT